MIDCTDKYFDALQGIMKDLERFTIFLTRSRAIAGDVLSEAILRGHASCPALKNEIALKSFMFTIISRTHKELLFKCRRALPSPPQDFDELYSKELSPEERTDVAIMYAALDSMPEAEREIIIMAELTGLPHKEIAEVLGISISNVKVRLFRAKQKLKCLMIPEQLSERKPSHVQKIEATFPESLK